MKPRCSVQCWDDVPPSRRDAMIVLNYALALLSESLPLAMAHIGAGDISAQEEFWRAYCELDKCIGFTSSAALKAGDYSDAISDALEDIRQIVESRINRPIGEFR